jgi:hypothetical protein
MYSFTITAAVQNGSRMQMLASGHRSGRQQDGMKRRAVANALSTILLYFILFHGISKHLNDSLPRARLATRKGHAARHLARAGAHAREVHGLLALAESRRYFVPGPRTGAVALARRLLDRLPPAA